MPWYILLLRAYGQLSCEYLLFLPLSISAGYLVIFWPTFLHHFQLLVTFPPPFPPFNRFDLGCPLVIEIGGQWTLPIALSTKISRQTLVILPHFVLLSHFGILHNTSREGK